MLRVRNLTAPINKRCADYSPAHRSKSLKAEQLPRESVQTRAPSPRIALNGKQNVLSELSP